MPSPEENGPKNNLVGEEEEFKTAMKDGKEPSLPRRTGNWATPPLT